MLVLLLEAVGRQHAHAAAGGLPCAARMYAVRCACQLSHAPSPACVPTCLPAWPPQA